MQYIIDNLANELNEAKKIQTRMLPQSVPDISGFQIAVYYLPAIAVGGDFYDFIPLEGDKTGIVLGDAVGHGISASLLMTMALSNFRLLAPMYESADKALNHINQRLIQSMQAPTFVASTYVILEYMSKSLSCAMAGLKPLLIKSEACFPIEPFGYHLPLGVFHKSDYQKCDIEMKADDVLVLFTDGVLEVSNEFGEFYGFKRLRNALLNNYRGNAQDIIDSVLYDIKQFIGGHPQEDDITIMLIKAIEPFNALPFIPPAKVPVEAKRLITALFVDTSQAESLSNTESSESLSRIMYQMLQGNFRQIASIIMDYEGTISDFQSDSLLSLFGVPISHENDAERAVLAALDIIKEMQKLQSKVSIGIHTALMTVNEIQAQPRKIYAAHNMDTGLAKSLGRYAKSWQILIDERTMQLTQGLFDFEALTEHSNVYTVQHEKTQPKKLRGIEGLRSQMIGRQRDFALLRNICDKWLQGQGSIVSISGEAGIGKSRLVKEIIANLGLKIKDSKVEMQSSIFNPQPLILEGRCISIGESISYRPFIDILRIYFNISKDDNPETTANKVKQGVIRLSLPSEETLPLLGNLLSIKFGNELDKILKSATPEQIKHQTLMQLKELFIAIVNEQPLMLVLEDMHWADDLSLDLVSLLLEELAKTQIMIVCVYRDEKDHRISQFSDLARRKCSDRYTEIRLNRLSDSETQEMLESLLGNEFLSETIKSMILKKAEGNPFFVEEMIRSLIDRNIIYYDDSKSWRSRYEITHVDIPDAIQGVIMARVDCLNPESKLSIRYASVIGRLFRYKVLENLMQRNDLDSFIKEFEKRGLVYEERIIPELEYAFKHAITQEAIYQSIQGEQKLELHHNVASVIERIYFDRLEEHYEELAHHYSESNNADKAIKYLLKSAEKAKNNFANESAIYHYQKALETISLCSSNRSLEELNSYKLDVIRGLGEVYLSIGKSVEAEQSFKEAIKLAKEINQPVRRLARLYNRISDALFWQGKYDEIIQYGEMGLKALENDMECLESALINATLALGYSNKGNNEKWVDYNQRNMSFIRKLPYNPELRVPYILINIVHTYHYNDLNTAWEWVRELEAQAQKQHDLRGVAGALMEQSDILKVSGDLTKSYSSHQRSIRIFQRIGDIKHEGWCHAGLSQILCNSGNIEESEEHAEKFLKIAEELETPSDVAWSFVLLGNIAMSRNRFDEAILHYQKSLEKRKNIGNPSLIPLAYFRLGRAYLKKGDYSQALQFFKMTIDDATMDFLPDTIRGIEKIYTDSAKRSEFESFCSAIKQKYMNQQWYLEPLRISSNFPFLAYIDDFDFLTIDQENVTEPPWKWVDEFGDCEYRASENGGLEILSANGRDFYGCVLSMPRLNLSAPRLMREASGDFAIEVRIQPASDDKPQIGGMLVWKDERNFLCLHKGVSEQHEIRFEGCIGGKYQFAGRGFLSEGTISYLRLERTGEQFCAYCSINGEDWFKCGKIALYVNDPIQIGVCAIGMIDRTVYCGEYKEGTATTFHEFKLWKAQNEF